MKEEPALGSGVSQGAQRDAAPDPSASDVGPAGGDVPAAVERTIQQKQSGPAPGLDPDTRALMEERMGADLGDVRIHTDSAASEASDALGAGAFTVGQDVFFAQGQFDPTSTGGQKLIAHEMAHTIQQGEGSAQARRIQREGNGEAISDDKTSPEPFVKDVPGVGHAAIRIAPAGEPKKGTFEIPVLRLPKIPGGPKGAKDNIEVPGEHAAKFNEIKINDSFLFKRKSKRSGTAENTFRNGLAGDEEITKGIKTMLDTDEQFKNKDISTDPNSAAKKLYLSQENRSSQLLLIGTSDEIAAHPDARRPTYDKKGKHIKPLKALDRQELTERGLIRNEEGELTRLNFFLRADGGAFRYMNIVDGALPQSGSAFNNLIKGFAPAETQSPIKIPEKVEDGKRIGHITGTPFGRRQDPATKDKKITSKFELVKGSKAVDLPVLQSATLGYGVWIDSSPLLVALKNLTFTGASPVNIQSAAIDQEWGIVAEGHIAATKARFPGLEIPIRIEGDDIFIEYPIPTERLSFGPVNLTEASLALGVGGEGLFMEGDAAVSVEQLGKGTLSARGEDGDVVISGVFGLELDFLDPAEIGIRYALRDDTLTGEATLGVDGGRLPGVESGEVRIAVSREAIEVSGTLNLGGVLAGGDLTVVYTPEAGLRLEGKDIPLPVSRLPGVTNAAVTVRAERNPDDGFWSLSGGGKATFVAAGASGTLDIHYDGEAITLDGRAEVARGPASGWIQITATNRAMDDEGNPVDDGAVGELSISGQGEASVAFGEILTGTAGLEYTPDGRTIISGEIAMQPRDLFEERRYEKTLLEVEPPEFPIWGVSLAGVGIGVFAFVNAIVRFEASLSPGQLRDTRVNATIDLDHPELATVEGNAQFFVPAFAGMTLDLGGGLRARATVAYVEGRVGLEGMLGIEADASANVNVQWHKPRSRPPAPDPPAGL